LVLVAAAGAAGEAEPNGDRGRGHGMRVSLGRRDGLVVMNGDGDGMSPLRMIGPVSNSASWVYSGRVPTVYRILGLTDEQSAALEKLCSAVRQEYRDMSKQLYAKGSPGQRPNPEQMRERHRKFGEMREELATRYTTRMHDVLTEEQRTLLAKIEDIGRRYHEEEKRIRDIMALATQQNRENHEDELVKALSEEQLAELKKLHDDRRNGWRGGIRKIPAQPQRKTELDDAGPDGNELPVETF
jgi:hypothetical protein